MSLSRIPFLIVSIALLAQSSRGQQRIGGQNGLGGAPTPATVNSGLDAFDVRVMPGYPNAPKLSPEERRPVRPGAEYELVLWGNLNNGDPIGPGRSFTYEWVLDHGDDLEVVHDGSLSGSVTDPTFVYEAVRANLLNGILGQTFTATLVITDDLGESQQAALELVVLDRLHPNSASELDELQFDVNVAIEDGLRFLYRQQKKSGSDLGSWDGYSNYDRGTTGFALWAFQNQGHLWREAFADEDIYAEVVRRGLNYLLAGAQESTDITAPHATTLHGAMTDGKADMNGNMRSVDFSPTSREGYENPVICAAILASLDPNRTVEVPGFLQDATYLSVVEDAIDWMGSTQMRSGYGRGGWDYSPSNGSLGNHGNEGNHGSVRSDMSINSWYYIAMEGAQGAGAFNIAVPDWIKLECERAVYLHFQKGPGGQHGSHDNPGLYGRGFGYASNSNGCGSPAGEYPVRCGLHGQATTAAGLSGLALLETMSPSGQAASFISAQPNFNTITDIRGPALEYLGASWEVPGQGGANGNAYGNKRNYYAMWTVARALRLTAAAIGQPDGENIILRNGSVDFDWTTGEFFEQTQNGLVGTGVLGTPGNLEGYYPWLVRFQNTTSGITSTRGSWGTGTPSGGSHFSGSALSTAWSLLVLTPRVFPQPCSSIADNIIDDVRPTTESYLPAGSTVVLSGKVTPDGSGLPITGVFIDGSPADSLDTAGNFFERVHVDAGHNEYEVVVVQPCGDVSAIVSLYGTEDGEVVFEQYESVSFQVEPEYSNTTWIPSEQILQVDVSACNSGENALIGPVLMVFDTFTSTGVTLDNPDGYTDAGEPYVFFGYSPEDPDFASGDCSVPRSLRFKSVVGQSVQYNLEWLAPINQPPVFTTIPPTTAVAGGLFNYASEAMDPNGHEVVYSPLYGPPGMTIDPQSGLVLWSVPGNAHGAYSIGIRAEDGFGGESVQEFTVALSGSIVNRPPFFTSVPPTHSSVGAAFEYQASAEDPDLDPLGFDLIEGPVGMSSTPNGLVTWPVPLPGDHSLRMAVSDGQGGAAEQGWVLSVGNGSSNPHAPVLFGTPSTVAVVGSPYAYQPFAYDLDDDDLLFTLEESPAGMTIDPITGFLRWTPSFSSLGLHQVELKVDDQNGGTATQSWPVEVFEDAVNRAPIFETIPPLVGVVGESYTYDADAIDPDEDDVLYGLETGPAGMTIHDASGLVQWVPQAPGDFTVAVTATDPFDAVGSQVYTVHVIPPNEAPTITSLPSTESVVGGIWSYVIEAEDPEGQPLRYNVVEGPEGLSLHSQVGYASWQPALDDLGDHDVELRVDDGFGGSATQQFTITVAPDDEAPTVIITATPSPAVIGQPVEICVIAGDNVSVTSKVLEIDGVLATLAPNGCTTIIPDALGQISLHAVATDAAENEGTADFLLEVVEEPVPQVGDVTVHSPFPGELIDTPTPIIATVQGVDAGVGPAPEISWLVRIRAADSQGAWRNVAQGEGAVDETRLALFDPTLLRNGFWRVQVLASVNSGPMNGLEFPVEVHGDFKLGHFETTLTDLVVPVAGIPMVVARQYSSLSDEPGDFGPGWRLALPGDVSDGPREGTNDTFNTATRVYVTRTDGRRVGFTARFTPLNWIFPFLGTVSFEPDSGIYDSLETLTSPILTLAGGVIYGDLFATPYNPDEYVFETSAGVKYQLHEIEGLQHVEDILGNTIDVTPGGLFSSTGVSIQFQRDGQGRIERITEPSGPAGSGPPKSIEFVYDPTSGNLVSSTNRAGEMIEYFYDNPLFPHYLTEVHDPLGNTIVRNVLDEDARIIAQCGPDGDVQTLEGCLQFDLDVESSIQTIIDGRGYESTLEIDAVGRILRQIVYDDQGSMYVTEREYDDEGNVIRVTDADTNTAYYTYDEDGNLTSSMTPGGKTTHSTYEPGTNRLLSHVDGIGNLSSFEYDEEGRLLKAINSLGAATAYGYDTEGRVRSIIDATGATWSFDYDARGFPSLMTDPRGEVAHVTYDYLGRLSTRVDRDGRRIDFSYDAEGRLLTETWIAAPNVVHDYDYDAGGRLVNASGPDGSFSIEYWNDGSLKAVENTGNGAAPTFRVLYGTEVPGGLEVSGYDGNGNLTRVTDSLGGETSIGYDRLNLPRVIQHQGSDGLTTNKRVELDFNRLGKITEARRFASLDDSAPVVQTTYEYTCAGCSNALSRILQTRMGTGEIIRDTTYGRNPIGWIESLMDGEASLIYSVDGTGQLQGASGDLGGQPYSESYDHDPIGNRETSHVGGTHIYEDLPGGAKGRLLQTDDFAYEYDAEGNLRLREDLASGESLVLDVDHRRRVRQVRVLDDQGTELARETYFYDPANRLIRVAGPNGVQHILYDGLNPIVELDAAGVLVVRRLYDRPVDSVLAEDRVGSSHWFLKDNVLSVTQAVENSQAAGIAEEWRYDSFGRDLAGSTNGLSRMRFQSRPFSEVSGLGYFRNRWYESSSGRFAAEDVFVPYGYSFASNNPLIGMDPMGTSTLIEYACLAAQAASAVNRIKPYADSLANLYTILAKIVDSPTPENIGRVDGALDQLGDGIAGLFPVPTGAPVGTAFAAARLWCATGPAARARIDRHYNNLRSDIGARTPNPSDIRNWNRGGWWGYTSGPGRNFIHIR